MSNYLKKTKISILIDWKYALKLKIQNKFKLKVENNTSRQANEQIWLAHVKMDSLYYLGLRMAKPRNAALWNGAFSEITRNPLKLWHVYTYSLVPLYIGLPSPVFRGIQQPFTNLFLSVVEERNRANPLFFFFFNPFITFIVSFLIVGKNVHREF